MAKRFMFVSFGILCLVAAYQLGAEQARADWDPAVGGSVIGARFEIVYNGAGEAWMLSAPSIGGWSRQPESDLPVSVSEVKFLSVPR
jgi:hypothetical protein